MSIIDPRTWMEHLSVETCWELLRTTPVGRVAVMVDGAPELYPVNFVVDGRTVAFRTDPGSKLQGLERFPTTCFEADVIEPERHTGWSVMVKGRAETVIDPDERAHLTTMPLTLWTAGPKDHWVRMRPVEVTGRRIHSIAAGEPDPSDGETGS